MKGRRGARSALDKDWKRSVLQLLQRSLITMLDLVCLIRTKQKKCEK